MGPARLPVLDTDVSASGNPPASDGSRWKWAARAGLIVASVVAWEGLARGLGSLMLPSASATLAALAGLAHSGELWRALWTSNQALLLGYVLAVAIGTPLGLLVGRAPKLGAFADVFLDILLFTPMPAAIPLLVMATGLGLQTRLLVVFVFAVAIIAVHAAAGARSVDVQIVEMARAFGAGRIRLYRRVILPGAVPSMLVGLRLGLARGISGMVAVELLLVAVGLGRLIERFEGDFDAPGVYAVVLVIVAEAVLLTGVLQRVERGLALRRGAAGVA